MATNLLKDKSCESGSSARHERLPDYISKVKPKLMRRKSSEALMISTAGRDIFISPHKQCPSRKSSDKGQRGSKQYKYKSGPGSHRGAGGGKKRDSGEHGLNRA